MCGISVLITKNLNKDNLKTFNTLLESNESRGGDSVGVYLYTEDHKTLFYDLSPTSELVLNGLNNFIKYYKLFNKPVVILGHTRATATGSSIHYHPAISNDGDGDIIMIHNGVIYDEYSYYYHPNDTYHLADLLNNEVFTKRDKKSLKHRISTSGTTLFYINKKLNSLNFCKIGYTPLKYFKTDNSLIFSSIDGGLKELLSNYKSGFYKINLNQLFDHKKISVKKDVKYITNDLSRYNKNYYNITNNNKCYNSIIDDPDDDELWNYDKGGVKYCGLYKDKCYGCLECLDYSEYNEIDNRNRDSLNEWFKTL